MTHRWQLDPDTRTSPVANHGSSVRKQMRRAEQPQDGAARPVVDSCNGDEAPRCSSSVAAATITATQQRRRAAAY